MSKTLKTGPRSITIMPPTRGAQAGIATNKAVRKGINHLGTAVINTRHFIQAFLTGRVPL